jgi:spore maturation protein CgeB
MRIFVFGSSITSSYWNGAATYYRGIYKQLRALGHRITFAEPDAYSRLQNRDAGDFSYVETVVYKEAEEIPALLKQAAECDLVVKHSGVGVFDELLEEKVLECRSANTRVAFWDVDAPATLSRVETNPADAFRALIPEYDFIFTYGGGVPVVDHYQRLGAANCHPIFRAAELAPDLRFALGGEGWGGKRLPPNVRWIGHVGTGDHNRVNCSARMVLNINRDSMAGVGYSPPTRVFEAAGSGACLITDRWTGIEQFFTPEKEILVAGSAEEIISCLRTTSAARAKEIGQNMRARALRDHTYALRAKEVGAVLENVPAGAAQS